MPVLEISAYVSLLVQFITGLIDIWGLNLQISNNVIIFRQLLFIELMVQVVEFIFYVWMVFHIRTNKNITPYRYFDWAITTPSMLITLMAYLSIDLDDKTQTTTIFSFIKENSVVVVNVLILNWMMLACGLMGQLGYADPKITAVLGFVPFALYFYIIYTTFVKNTKSQAQRNVFYYFFTIWLLYGVAALLNYESKNIMYNILDLFAKNFFGLFLVYVLYQNSNQTSN
jgi:bacteriorhodopsin